MYYGVDKWSKTEKAEFAIDFFAMKPVIRKEAKGTVLIISPFNFPLWLSLPPVVSAMSSPYVDGAYGVSRPGPLLPVARSY